MEGQMSEDFFEKLVDEDNIGSAGSGSSFIENKESDNAKAFSNLSIEEVQAAKGDSGDNGERESGGGVMSVSSDGYRDNETDEGSVLVIPDNVVQSNDAALEAIDESDLQKSSNGVTSGMDVKEVDWSSFNSASHIHSGSISDFFNELGVYSGDLNGKDTGGYEVVSNDAVNVPVSMSGGIRSSTSVKHEEGGRYYGTQTENAIEGQDLPSSQIWGNIYPGWRYDPSTGQWLKIEGNESTVSTQENFYPSFASAGDNVVTEQRSDAYCFQLPLAEYKMGNVSNWDHRSQQKVEYPAHMVFDPQYPGWYYDTIVQEWRLLESYRAATTQPTNFSQNQRSQDRAFMTGSELLTEGNGVRDNFGQMRKFDSQGLTTQVKVSLNNYNQQNRNTWQTASLPNSRVMDIIDSQVSHIPHAPTYCASNSADQHNQQMSYRAATTQPTNFSHNQRSQDRAFTTGSELLTEGNHSVHDNFGQMRKFESQGLTSQVEVSLNNYNQQNMNTWQTAPFPNSGVIDIIANQVSHIPYAPNYCASNSGDQQNQQTWLPEQTIHSYASANSISGYQACIPSVNFCEPSNQHKPESSGPSPQMQFSPVNFDSQKSPDFSKPVQSGGQFPHTSSEGRSPAGRPPHALVTFGFGGKLIVMKDDSSFSNSAYGSKNSADGIISVLNLMDVVMDKSDASSIGLGACDYFHAICQQSLPGPLVGGNVGSREVNQWVDEKIASCESPDKDYRRGELLRRLFSLLKIGCQYRGKLRSPFGTDQSLKESDCPESAVAQLFASAKRNVGPYGAFSRCLQNFPSEREIQATALEVQKLLISGRLKDALQSAQEGQLWGPALALAAQLGDQFYSDTVKQMALCQLVVGSPLRTIFLLIAGQPADVFSNTTCTSSLSSLPGAVNVSQHSSQVCNGASCALDNWEENLAIITANRTKDDELVIIHFGDCLLKERGEIIAAHICYLVAETNFESHSDSARVCLIGADHWNFPRTYASPEAIQRTELYEYSKVLGNSQCIVLPFQPYKLVYAHMLAEVGKVSDSLKYCQAILKCLKPCRSPEVDAWKNLALSLEERIKVHQQGGYSANLAPAKLVDKLFNLFDSTSHRVVGGLPPPTPSTSHGSSQHNEHDCQRVGPRVSNSQSTMAMSSLMPSAITEPISEWQGGSNRSRHYRSISEPDFGKSPIKDGSSPDTQGNTPGTGGSSRFGRFRSQLFQKTVGLVLRSRPDRQAKLGEANRFYYDEKLKRWVEEGAENLSEEATLPPPPSNAAFQNIMLDNTSKDELKLDNSEGNGGSHHESQSPLELNLGKQPIPRSSDQLSARGRMGIRARYVDTFNKGGAAPPNLFQSPSLPAGKPGVGSNTKFFIPTPMALGDETVQTTGDLREAVVNNETPSTSVEMISSPPTSTSSTTTMHRVPSMDNIRRSRTGAMENGKGSLPPHSRRTVSWSGGFYDTSNTTNTTEIRPLGEAQGVPQPLLIPGNSSPMQFSMNTGNLGNDLHEVEL